MHNKSIVNLSTFNLNQDHISVLNRGLKFCPTPKSPNVGEMRDDMDRFHKRLRQMAFFENPEDPLLDLSTRTQNTNIQLDSKNLLSFEPFKHMKFKTKSAWNPPGPHNLEAMITCNEQQFNARRVTKLDFRDNLTKNQRKAMDELRLNDDIIIRSADKGGAICILNRLDYLKEGYRQLSDNRFYRKLDSNPTETFRKEIQNTIEDMFQNGEIDLSVKQYLTDLSCRTSQLYLLPKIHKNKNPPPGRPIISGMGSPTEKISQLVDHFLNPPNSELPSFVKDTTHFLQLLEGLGDLPDDTLLVTLDVTSLYTNIPNDEGIQAARETLHRSRPDVGVKPSNDTLIKLLEMVLTKNNFQFNGQNFLQTGGTAMGTKAAPGYAINSMGKFEAKFVYTYPKQPLLYLRFIDDIFIIWTHGRDSLMEFIDHLNNCSDSIKFTHEISDEQISFLDTLVRLKEGKLTTDLYTKPTDSHSYLRYESAHPQRCKDSIPYSQFLRIRRICSDISDFDRHVICLAAYFTKQGYPTALLQEAALQARELDRTNLLSLTQTNQEADTDKVFLISTYNPHDSCMRDLVFHNWDILGKSQTTDFLHKKKVVCGYRRPKNLRDILTKATIPYKQGDNRADPTFVEPTSIPTDTTVVPTTSSVNKQTSIMDFFKPGATANSAATPQATPGTTTSPIDPRQNISAPTQKSNKNRGFSFCNHTICRYCPLLNKSGKITCSVTGISYNCMKNISCRSSNLVYAITCTRCGIQYVGQTMLRVKDRFVHHFHDILTSNLDKTVSKHYSQSNHNGIKDIQITVLEFIHKPPRCPQSAHIRNRVEKNWTHLFRCMAPLGLNIENPKEYSIKNK